MNTPSRNNVTVPRQSLRAQRTAARRHQRMMHPYRRNDTDVKKELFPRTTVDESTDEGTI